MDKKSLPKPISHLMLVNKELVNSRARLPVLRFIRLYDVERSRQKREELVPYLPSKDELAVYADSSWFENTIESLNFLNFLNKLKIKEKSNLVDYYSNPIASKRLKNVIYLDDSEKNGCLTQNKNHWPLFGWSPYELANQFYDPNIPRKIAFAENLQKQFSSGELDKDDCIRQLEEDGFEVAEEEKVKRS